MCVCLHNDTCSIFTRQGAQLCLLGREVVSPYMEGSRYSYGHDMPLGMEWISVVSHSAHNGCLGEEWVELVGGLLRAVKR